MFDDDVLECFLENQLQPDSQGPWGTYFLAVNVFLY